MIYLAVIIPNRTLSQSQKVLKAFIYNIIFNINGLFSKYLETKEMDQLKSQQLG